MPSTEVRVTDLPRPQRVLVDRIRKSRENEQSRVREQAMQSRLIVRDALAAHVPIPILMEVLGVTKARVYQMRDEAEEYEASLAEATKEAS